MQNQYEFDHLSLAVRSPLEVGKILRRALGAEPLTGGVTDNFRYILFHVGDLKNSIPRGQRLELISTSREGSKDGFMGRFFQNHGEAPHHLSFNVPDLNATRLALREAGFTTVKEDFEHEEWQELFLPPDEIHSLVIQIASTPIPIRTERLYGRQNRQGVRLPNNRGARDPLWWAPLWETEPPEIRSIMSNVIIGSTDLTRSDVLFHQLLNGEISLATSNERVYQWRSGQLTVRKGDTGVRGVTITNSAVDFEIADVRISPANGRSCVADRTR